MIGVRRFGVEIDTKRRGHVIRCGRACGGVGHLYALQHNNKLLQLARLIGRAIVLIQQVHPYEGLDIFGVLPVPKVVAREEGCDEDRDGRFID